MAIIHDWDEHERLEELARELSKETCILCRETVESDYPYALVCDACLWGERIFKYFEYNKSLGGPPHHH